MQRHANAPQQFRVALPEECPVDGKRSFQRIARACEGNEQRSPC
jgi:hypothetical protein